jgi:hypothetical protein
MIPAQQALASLPSGLKTPLINCYQEIARNFSERRWEPAELNGGKFCEVAYSIINGALTGSFAAAPSKPRNMVDSCRALEQIPPDANRVGDRSLRVLIPRMLPVLYEIRNNRGVGHVGGDVDPNFQDAVAVFQMASWVMAELVRMFHQVSLSDAQATVDTLVERKHPIVWQEGVTKRVLDPSLGKGDQALLLLYSGNTWVEDKDLANWVEYTNLTQFRNRVLLPMHENRLVEYDRLLRRLKLTPRGSADVEQRLLPKYKV